MDQREKKLSIDLRPRNDSDFSVQIDSFRRQLQRPVEITRCKHIEQELHGLQATHQTDDPQRAVSGSPLSSEPGSRDQAIAEDSWLLSQVAVLCEEEGEVSNVCEETNARSTKPFIVTGYPTFCNAITL